MFVTAVPNRGSPPTVLVRQSYREDGSVKTRTLANLTKLPPEAIDAVRRTLKGEKLFPAEELFEILEGGSRLHGHVAAVIQAMKRLEFARLICSRSSKERNLVQAMVVSCIVQPNSKLAMTRGWHTTTIPEIFRVARASEDDLYKAMDWLLRRQDHIEKRLADRHLANGGMAFFDLTSSYFEGKTCPLARRGHNRDGKRGKLQVNYGLLTDRGGVPVSVAVFEGNTGDPKTLMPQVRKVREKFGIDSFVIVGDRGMITQKQINELKPVENMDWISALRPRALQALFHGGAIQLDLFDERNLFEIRHPEFPGERLIACRNPALAKRRANKRKQLIQATCRDLEKVCRMVKRGQLNDGKTIEEKVRKILAGYKVGRHFAVQASADGVEFTVDERAIVAAELARGGTEELTAKRIERRLRHVETVKEKLLKLRLGIEQGRLSGKDKIGVRVGRVLNKHKVGKHFQLDIQATSFSFEIDNEKVAAEAALDGIYVVRTSVEEDRLDAEEAIRSYKRLSKIERAFRSFKTMDLHVRPIRHHLEPRVRAHILLCMLAYYVLCHMLEAWRPLLFCDEDKQAKEESNPVVPSQRSVAAQKKASSKKLENGDTVHSFQTLLHSLSTIVRNRCRRIDGAPGEPSFDMTTPPTREQQQAISLLNGISI